MKIMAVDFGDARTGLAVCDRTEFLASPIGVIHEKEFSETVRKVAIAVVEYDVKMVVVGHPLNMDGSVGERAELCEKFADELSETVSVPVKLWDERSTTVSATNYLNQTDTRGKKRKEVIDAVAATIILESFLNYRKNHPEE
jgi:putative Holliday junction resolvase